MYKVQFEYDNDHEQDCNADMGSSGQGGRHRLLPSPGFSLGARALAGRPRAARRRGDQEEPGARPRGQPRRQNLLRARPQPRLVGQDSPWVALSPGSRGPRCLAGVLLPAGGGARQPAPRHDDADGVPRALRPERGLARLSRPGPAVREGRVRELSRSRAGLHGGAEGAPRARPRARPVAPPRWRRRRPSCSRFPQSSGATACPGRR